MASKRQLEANRSNARRSTGPQTPSGKSRSRMNALKHGLSAKSIVIGDERPEEFEALRDAVSRITAQAQPSQTSGRALCRYAMAPAPNPSD